MTLRVVRLLAALGVVAVASASQPVGVRAADTTVIRVGEVNTDLYSEAYYALDAGFFKSAGLTIEITTFPTGGASATAVAAGAVDIAVTNPISVANAVEHGVPLTVVANGGLYSSKAPSTALCVGAKSAFRTPADFAGKTVAVSSLNNLEQIGFEAWLSANNVDPSGVHFIELKSTQMGAALERGTIDAAMITDPALSFAVKSGTRIFAPAFNAIALQFPISIWVSPTAWASRHADLVKRFASVIYQAGRWANTHHDQTAASLNKYTTIDLATIQGMQRAIYAESLDATALQKELDMAYKYKLISRPLMASQLLLPEEH
jgi:NitT/TauT family transport system substrate-binding protein